MTVDAASGHWRGMRVADLPEVKRISDVVHPAFPEDEAVFANRLALFPEGSLVLDTGTEGLGGYAVAHPARLFEPPPLNTRLPALAGASDALFIHDVALLAAHRGRGRASLAARRLLALADPFGAASLISVYGTVPFWSRFGFAPDPSGRAAERLRAYGPDAVFMIRRAARLPGNAA